MNSAFKAYYFVGENIELGEGQVDYHKEMANASPELEIEWVDREDGLNYSLYIRINR